MPIDLNEAAQKDNPFLKKERFLPNQGADLTIADIRYEEIGTEKESKPVITWKEPEKPMICNKTNLKIITFLYGSTPEQYIGKKVHVYHNPLTEFAGNIVGGLSVSTPRQAPVEAPEPVVTGGNTPINTDDIPHPADTHD